MRILHLIDASSPQACPTTFALLSDSLGRLGNIEQKVLLLGGKTLECAAKAGGVNTAHRIGVPYGRAILGWATVRRYLNELGAFDLIHCWSMEALTIASLLRPRVPRILTITTQPSPRSVRWLRLLTHEMPDRILLLPISNALRTTVLSAGIDPAIVHVLRPSLDLAKTQASQRSLLRSKWGISDVDNPRIKVITFLSDPCVEVDAQAAHMTVGLADEAYALHPGGRPAEAPVFWFLAHPLQKHLARAERVAQEVGRTDRIIQEPRVACPWEVLPGCDLAIAQGPSSGGLSLLWAMVANVPIIGEATYAVSEILEDRHSALLAKPDNPRMLAGRILQLTADPQLAWKLRDTARHEAFSFFSRQRYCQTLQSVYEQVLSGTAVEISDLPVTGGLRFAGRA